MGNHEVFIVPALVVTNVPQPQFQPRPAGGDHAGRIPMGLRREGQRRGIAKHKVENNSFFPK